MLVKIKKDDVLVDYREVGAYMQAISRKVTEESGYVVYNIPYAKFSIEEMTYDPKVEFYTNPLVVVPKSELSDPVPEGLNDRMKIVGQDEEGEDILEPMNWIEYFGGVHWKNGQSLDTGTEVALVVNHNGYLPSSQVKILIEAGYKVCHIDEIELQDNGEGNITFTYDQPAYYRIWKYINRTVGLWLTDPSTVDFKIAPHVPIFPDTSYNKGLAEKRMWYGDFNSSDLSYAIPVVEEIYSYNYKDSGITGVPGNIYLKTVDMYWYKDDGTKVLLKTRKETFVRPTEIKLFYQDQREKIIAETKAEVSGALFYEDVLTYYKNNRELIKLYIENGDRGFWDKIASETEESWLDYQYVNANGEAQWFPDGTTPVTIRHALLDYMDIHGFQAMSGSNQSIEKENEPQTEVYKEFQDPEPSFIKKILKAIGL